jgi:hypothetical protein
MIVDKWFRKAKLLNKKKGVVILVAEVMVTKVVEEEELAIDKVQERVIDYALPAIAKGRRIAAFEP